jgi:quercetin dioxygenase-like cupin family protein
MFIRNIKDIEKKEISGEGIKNVLKQVPIGPGQGWKDQILRVFTIKSKGHTPRHSHDWEHINYVISGSGTLEISGQEHQLEVGHFAVVPANTVHQYSNDSNQDLVMICIVPSHGDY